MTGLLHRLLGGHRSNAGSSGLTLEAAQSIVQEYANFLEISAPLPGRVTDVTRLPRSKDTIKEAIRVCIGTARDPELIKHLQNGYLMLSAWQYGVGEKTLGLDYSRLDLDADPLELAEVIQQNSTIMNKWEKIIKKEQATLKSELGKLCLQGGWEQVQGSQHYS